MNQLLRILMLDMEIYLLQNSTMHLTELTSGVVFGGTGTSYGTALAVDQQNYIYVTGATNAANFPAVTNTNIYPNNGFQTNKGEYDAFVVKLSKQYLENIRSSSIIGRISKGCR